MIGDLVVALLACAAIAYVASGPRAAPKRWPDAAGVAEEEAQAKKNAALEAIIDMEDERNVGKLSEEDFEALRREYEADALEALLELDALERVPDDDALEAEIAAMRARLVCASCGATKNSAGPCDRCGA